MGAFDLARLESAACFTLLNFDRTTMIESTSTQYYRKTTCLSSGSKLTHKRKRKHKRKTKQHKVQNNANAIFYRILRCVEVGGGVGLDWSRGSSVLSFDLMLCGWGGGRSSKVNPRTSRGRKGVPNPKTSRTNGNRITRESHEEHEGACV